MAAVLDVCCGGKMFYFDKQNPLVNFCDSRRETHTLCDGRVFKIEPDTLCDFRALPFADGQFNLVIFDPPHLLEAQCGATSWVGKKYGRLPKEFKPYLQQGFNECFRVLRRGGTLIFKWNEDQIAVKEIVALSPVEPLLDHKSGNRSKTHWIVFYKE